MPRGRDPAPGRARARKDLRRGDSRRVTAVTVNDGRALGSRCPFGASPERDVLRALLPRR
ncbi:MAG: hypothetical protein CMH82_14115 [Nocardioides sp.]|nr:hypothetical protein [Nocardioides sp.]